ncbi:MAG: cysteine peptidase family C39 domain-containing protein [Rhodobacteraceae bacterium]|nr:cysteine peptidase family C39 domain-containing protein [Paracoccaceae bacterium]MCY4197250.1 cysteine peptidase family C39 domain-containing protein [Paracoccaceae bacterium]
MKFSSSINSKRTKPDKRVVTPLVMQMHMTECGAACLGSILALFGRWVPLSELRQQCAVSRDGSTAAGLARAARHYGLECKGRRVQAHNLQKMPMPQILFWEWSHFLILEGFDAKHAYLNDPAMGRRTLSYTEFADGFSGIALHLKPSTGFVPGAPPPGVLHRFMRWFQGSYRILFYIVASSLVVTVLGLTAPLALGVFIDRHMVEGRNLGAISIAILLAAVVVFFVSRIKQHFISRLSMQMSIALSEQCVSTLLRLPIHYFSHRLSGDLTNRILSIDRISRGVQRQLVESLVEVAMSAVYLIAILILSPQLAMIVLTAAILTMFATRFTRSIRSEGGSLLRREQTMLLAVGMLMVQQADGLRMTASEHSFFSRWSGHQARELSARQRYFEIGHLDAAIPGLLVIVTYALVLAFGANAVITGDMTLGALVTIFVLAGLYLSPIGRLSAFANGFQEMVMGLQGIEDITESEMDSRFSRRHSTPDNRATTATLNGKLQLNGHIELRGINFGYDRGRPPLIKDFNLIIRPGQRIAIVGSSGSGKSTLASLILGGLEPWSGEILLDGLPRDEIPNEVIVRSLSVVEQKPFLFSASVRDNITLWNPMVPDKIVVAAARDAGIHKQILQRSAGYAEMVDEDGGNFSGGECQKLELARALVTSPTLLILDEATSALDADAEKEVDDALRRRGVSCLVVAHRLSTIRDCDEIVVMEKGIAVQRGTHIQLMSEADGHYRQLIEAG